MSVWLRLGEKLKSERDCVGVIQFARSLTDEYAGEDIAVVELAPDLRPKTG
jgi:hypothetical protein